MKIYKNLIFILTFYLLNEILTKIINEVEDEDEDIVYSPSSKHDSSPKNHPTEDVKHRIDNIKSNMVNLGYDFSKAIQILYSNYSSIDVKVSDIDYLYQKGIINENQAIMIWENLLNAKTERNLEWLGYNKLLRNDQKESTTGGNKIIQNLMSLFNNPEMKIQSTFSYLGGIICYYLMKICLKYPKFNMILIMFLLMANITNSFYFYNNKCYFTSFISLCSFISNIYFFYLSLVTLCGNKVIDYSILHTKHFKSKEHFLVKISICTFLIFLLNYLVSVSLRYFLNYLLIFYFLEKNRNLIKNYCKLITPKNLQPFESFIKGNHTSVEA